MPSDWLILLDLDECKMLQGKPSNYRHVPDFDTCYAIYSFIRKLECIWHNKKSKTIINYYEIMLSKKMNENMFLKHIKIRGGN